MSDPRYDPQGSDRLPDLRDEAKSRETLEVDQQIVADTLSASTRDNVEMNRLSAQGQSVSGGEWEKEPAPERAASSASPVVSPAAGPLAVPARPAPPRASEKIEASRKAVLSMLHKRIPPNGGERFETPEQAEVHRDYLHDELSACDLTSPSGVARAEMLLDGIAAYVASLVPPETEGINYEYLDAVVRRRGRCPDDDLRALLGLAERKG